MSHTLPARAASLTVSALLMGAAVYMALNMRYLVDAVTQIDPVPVVSVRPDPPKPIETPPLTRESQPLAPAVLAPPAPLADPSDPPRLSDVVFPVAPAGPPMIANPSWIERPRGADFIRFYPDRALTRGISGAVALDCVVDMGGRVACTVAAEDPVGWGFGAASLRASQLFRMAPATADGQPTSGGRVRIAMRWNAG